MSEETQPPMVSLWTAPNGSCRLVRTDWNDGHPPSYALLDSAGSDALAHERAYHDVLAALLLALTGEPMDTAWRTTVVAPPDKKAV